MSLPSVSCPPGPLRDGCALTVPANANPEISVADATICEGESAELCAVASDGVTFLWDDGSTDRCIMVSEGGAYCVTVTDDNGCTASDCDNSKM